MTKNKHLTFDERNEIEIMLKRHCSFRQIASSLSKDPTTISKEIHSHSLSRRIGGVGVNYNACAFRFKCLEKRLEIKNHSTHIIIQDYNQEDTMSAFTRKNGHRDDYYRDKIKHLIDYDIKNLILKCNDKHNFSLHH